VNPYRLRAYLLWLIVVIIWGIAGPVIKLTLNGLPSDVFLAYRFFLSSLVTIFLIPFGILKFPRNSKILLNVFLYGFLTSTASLGLLFWGTEKTTLLDMSIISILGPIITILFGYYFLKETITSREKIGIAIAIIGSLIILIEPILDIRDGLGSVFGNILIIGSLLLGTLSIVILKKLLRENISPIALSNVSSLIGFVTLLPFILLKYRVAFLSSALINLPLIYHLGVFYMAFLSGTLAYALVNTAQKSIEISESALFAYLYPIISAIFAILLLGDKLTMPVIIGSIITFLGVAIAELKKRRYN
jgi:drug/metabolite transporter (DMT)-like permease